MIDRRQFACLTTATLLAASAGPAAPFLAAAGAVLLAVLILILGHSQLARANGVVGGFDELAEAAAIGAGDS